MSSPIMTKFNIITSFCRNGGIGRNGYIPWTISNSYDTIFRKVTRGNGNNAILMGSNTYDNRMITMHTPFAGRSNLVLSRNENYTDQNPYRHVEYLSSIENVLSHCKESNYDEVWIIGGESVYREFLTKPIVPIKNIVLNYIDKEYRCDKFFPMKFVHNNNIETLTITKEGSYMEYVMKVDYDKYPI